LLEISPRRCGEEPDDDQGSGDLNTFHEHLGRDGFKARAVPVFEAFDGRGVTGVHTA
jgi:hypothetical protein